MPFLFERFSNKSSYWDRAPFTVCNRATTQYFKVVFCQKSTRVGTEPKKGTEKNPFPFKFYFFSIFVFPPIYG